MSKKTSKFAVTSTAKLVEAGVSRFVPDASRATKSADLPFETMKKGESFLVPVQYDATTVQRIVSAAACNYARKTAKKFATRQVKSGVRVWRIK